MNEDKKPTFFVSRRGRQVGVHEVDMSGIDIESTDMKDDVVEKKDIGSMKTSKSSAKQPVSQKKGPWTKKKKLTLIGLALALISFPLLIAELVTAQYDGTIVTVKKDMQQIIDKEVLPAQKNSIVTADQLKSISSDINQLSTRMCRGGLIDNLANLYPRAKQAHVACKESKAKYVSLAKTLSQLEAQARYLEKVANVIKPISTPITDEFAVIGDQQTSWTRAKDELNKLNPPIEYKSVHSELVSKVGAVSNNWLKLNEANASQDKTGFEEAEKNLTVDYEAVRATSTEFSSILSTTQSKVLNSYTATK